MTKLTLESLEASGFEGIIREEPLAGGMPCFVHHREAGGWCEHTAVMRAYDMNFCEAHGAEIKAGVMAEIYHDAYNVLTDLARREHPDINAVTDAYQTIGRDEMAGRCASAQEAEDFALLKAYPLREDLVDTETRHHYEAPDPRNDDPSDVFSRARMHALKLMRLSWQAGEYWTLEGLELGRQGASVQLAYALALDARRTASIA